MCQVFPFLFKLEICMLQMSICDPSSSAFREMGLEDYIRDSTSIIVKKKNKNIF